MVFNPGVSELLFGRVPSFGLLGSDGSPGGVVVLGVGPGVVGGCLVLRLGGVLLSRLFPPLVSWLLVVRWLVVGGTFPVVRWLVVRGTFLSVRRVRGTRSKSTGLSGEGEESKGSSEVSEHIVFYYKSHLELPFYSK